MCIWQSASNIKLSIRLKERVALIRKDFAEFPDISSFAMKYTLISFL